MGLDNPVHLAFILVVALLVFGAKRLPEMGRSLGEGMRGFKAAINGEPARQPMAAMSPPQAVGDVSAETPDAVAVNSTTVEP